MSSITLKIKSTSSQTEFSITITPSTTTVAELKGRTLSELKLAPGRRVRLIAQGKLLAPDTEMLSKFPLSDSSYVHCVISPVGSTPSSIDPSSPAPPQPSDDDDYDLENPAALRGFDTLRTSGVSRSEITAIRTYFTPQVNEYAGTAATIAGETDGDRIYRMEEEWMRRQSTNSEFRVNLGRGRAGDQGEVEWQSSDTSTIISASLGTERDFIWGFILGFFVGFFLLFWIWMPSVSHRQKLGILAGIGVQMLFNMVVRGGIDSETGMGRAV
ncbi:hypothetical protein TrVE_jg12717 [Triparma verrucosa]|uniref:Ubiquitin-like domain-containing protein n=2 Tax=Triparma TaxID=722752 RepID=A0A9W7BX65_9STRA|nr:hypothetical protein TrST_g974 [Triparma strigata]GMI10551.1 hypothetical protein TrVE_jg12717 [Triparma verrucosa]